MSSADDSPSPGRGFRTEAATSGDHACERKMRKGTHVYVRTDITDCADGIHARLAVQNPRNVVGTAETFAHEYAVMCARILNFLRENITTTRIVLIEGDGATGVFAEAEELDRRCDLRRKRDACPNLVNGYCSPSTPDCPLYCNGRCRQP